MTFRTRAFSPEEKIFWRRALNVLDDLKAESEAAGALIRRVWGNLRCSYRI